MHSHPPDLGSLFGPIAPPARVSSISSNVSSKKEATQQKRQLRGGSIGSLSPYASLQVLNSDALMVGERESSNDGAKIC
jgi:hypothetical protein